MPFRRSCAPEKRIYAKNLRRHPTKSETILWNYLRYKQLGFIFRRQQVILGWIVDFYCHKAKLAIEVDGPGHDMLRKEHDQHRDQIMWEHGIITLRVDSKSVEQKPNAVADWIKDHAVNRCLWPKRTYQVHYIFPGEFKG